MNKKLIINADDAGIFPAINDAIEQCYAAGTITGTSIMACGKYFKEACDMLQGIGKTEVGVHFTLTGGFSPCTDDVKGIKSLVKESGVFPKDCWQFFVRYFRGLKYDEIYLEFTNQIKKVKKQGLKITHLDSHEHIHMFPQVLDVTIKLAKQFHVPYIRMPSESPVVLKKYFNMKRFLMYNGLNIFAVKAKKTISKERIKQCDVFWGCFHSGRISDDIMSFFINNLKNGINEIAVHPGIKSPKLLEESPWHKNARNELNILLNGKWKDLASFKDIQLIAHSGA